MFRKISAFFIKFLPIKVAGDKKSLAVQNLVLPMVISVDRKSPEFKVVKLKSLSVLKIIHSYP